MHTVERLIRPSGPPELCYQPRGYSDKAQGMAVTLSLVRMTHMEIEPAQWTAQTLPHIHPFSRSDDDKDGLASLRLLSESSFHFPVPR